MRDTFLGPKAPASLILVAALAVTGAMAHTPQVDADLEDWCLGAPSNAAGAGRIEDSSAILECGNCSVSTNLACEVNTDCPGGETCVNIGSKVELVWWDNRTDGAVNDLGTVAMTTDNEGLYVTAQLWVDPDPNLLVFGEVAIDFAPGGATTWYDPKGALTNSGTCSVDTDRGCTRDADCHFCTISTEPFPSDRNRVCGSDDPTFGGTGLCSDEAGDVCVLDQTCVGVGSAGSLASVGLNASPPIQPDFMLVYDFSWWLATGQDDLQVRTWNGSDWGPPGPPGGPLFSSAVNPGASGGAGGPPGSVETKIPWSTFGCTGCPAACECPGFGPGQDFRFSMIVVRQAGDLDWQPDGPIEDVLSEAVGGATTTTTNDCPGFGLVTTNCELADGSTDAFIPPAEAAVPGGRTSDLLLDKNPAVGLSLVWAGSCSSADDDYEIYEGAIGDWYTHDQLLCSTGGATSADIAADPGDRYYLIVPAATEASEGSYGVDSAGTERPVGVDPCLARVLGTCP